MDIRHFHRADEHRTVCHSKAVALEGAADLEVAARYWSEFLVEHQRWYTRMQQAFERGPSAAWFGKLKARRQSDPLLLYLHQARHADEHGLDRIAVAEPGGLGIGVGGGHVHIERLEIRNGVITQLVGSQDGGPLKVRFTKPHLKLNVVQNRGKAYEPPMGQLGGEPFDALRATAECLDIMEQASAEGRAFFYQ